MARRSRLARRRGAASRRRGAASRRRGAASRRRGAASRRRGAASRRRGAASRRRGAASRRSRLARRRGAASRRSRLVRKQKMTTRRRKGRRHQKRGGGHIETYNQLVDGNLSETARGNVHAQEVKRTLARLRDERNRSSDLDRERNDLIGEYERFIKVAEEHSLPDQGQDMALKSFKWKINRDLGDWQGRKRLYDDEREKRRASWWKGGKSKKAKPDAETRALRKAFRTCRYGSRAVDAPKYWRCITRDEHVETGGNPDMDERPTPRK